MNARDFTLGVFAGAVLSAVGTTLVYKSTLTKLSVDYDDRLEAEVKATIDHLVEEQLDLRNVDISNDLDADAPDEVEEASNEPLKMVVTSEDPIEADDVDEREIVPSALTASLEKPSLEELTARNQKTQYHKLVEESTYGDPSLEPPEPAYLDPDITVITKAEFLANESEFEQQQLTYFSDGGVLDMMNEYIEDHGRLIGEAEPPFGQDSDEADVVYIRNSKLEQEYEVKKDPGNASEFLAHSLQHLWNGPER